MANKRAQPFTNLVSAVSSWQQALASVRTAIANYEQILFLFLLPSLVLILARFYLGTSLSSVKSIEHLRLVGHQWVGLYLIIIWFIWCIINYPATIYFRLQATKNERAPSVIESYRSGFKLFGRIWLTSIITSIVVAIGVVLLIIPGVILFRRYVLSVYYAADNPQLKLRDIFKRSAEQSRSFSMAIYSTFIVLAVVTLVSDFIFSSYTIGYVFIYLISYLVLFMPALRYVEVSSHFNKKSQPR